MARAKSIFLDALDVPEAERDAFVHEACGDDAELRAAVNELLGAYGRAEDVFDVTRETRDEALPADDFEEAPGTTIGRYKIISRLGEGGFGVVFLAEQSEPIHRQVALKVIKLGMDTKQVIARFQAERQALALMDHPGIARVLDVGTTERGRPFFVMELVKGDPITEYCSRNRLSIRRRLRLFIDTSLAVHHAHQKGIIHRDLKPRNVLVTLQDNQPTPKIIDFGIAKAMHHRLTEHTLDTAHGQVIGTPAYMSPEQAEQTGLDTDTRTDIYSLGVLLYEVLTGVTPFDKQRLRDAGLAEIQRIILEEEPPRPSTHDPTLKGDLDWIVMKALEKDRTRRYESAYAFAADVQRHLADEAVLASPPSVLYRARKFTRRHRASVAAATLMTVAIIVGVAGAVWGLFESQVAAARANSVNAFMRDILTSVAPAEDGAAVRLIDVMGRAAESVGERFADDPIQEAEARILLADVFRSQAMYRTALEQIEPALVILREHFGDDDPRTLAQEYGRVFCIGHSGSIEELEATAPAMLPVFERTLGPSHRNTLDVRRLIALIDYRRGRYRDAESKYREVLADAEAALGPDDIIAVNAVTGIAFSLDSRIRSNDVEDVEATQDERESLLRDILERQRRRTGDASAATLGTTSQLASLLADRHQFAEARALAEDAFVRAEQSLDEKHWARAGLTRVLAQLYERAGDPRAGDYAMRAIEARRASLGDDDISTITSMSDLLPLVVSSSGRYERAEAIARHLVRTLSRYTGGGPSHMTDTFEIQLARCLIGLERFDEADAIIEGMVQRGEGVTPHDRVILALARADRAEAMGDLAGAAAHQQAAIDLRATITTESPHMYPEVMQRRLDQLSRKNGASTG